MERSFLLARWRMSIVLVVVCVLSSTCRCGDRSRPARGAESAGTARVTEPRLSGFDAWQHCEDDAATPGTIVKQAHCGPPTIPPEFVSMVDGDCERRMRTMTDAVQILAYVPACTDVAVAKLEELSENRSSPELLTNLAAGYYLRAQRKDRPSDLVRALSAANAAVALQPTPAALYNRALTQESLELSSDALQSWRAVEQEQDGDWSREAKLRRAHLESRRNVAAATEWHLNEQRLPEVAHLGDRKAVEALIAPYRAAAQWYVEDTVLVAWAKAREDGNSAKAAEQLQLAEVIAQALASLTKDPYLNDVIRGIRRADPSTEANIRNGIRAYANGRIEERKLRNDRVAEEAYARAERAFADARNPFRLMAIIKRVAQLTIARDFDRASRLLADVELDARSANYRSILGRVHTARGFMAMRQDRWLDAVVEYKHAETPFRETGDLDTLCRTLTRSVGIYRIIGNHDLTWREIFKTQACAAQTLGPAARHVFLGEVAASALDLGHPTVALQFQTSAITLLQETLRQHPDDEVLVAEMNAHLGIAYSARAAIHAHIGDDIAAERDLNEALSRIGKDVPESDLAIVNGFRARLAEVEAQTLAAKDAHREAIAALSRGIHHASQTHFNSLLASLLVQRAKLHAATRDYAAEIADLRTALDALRKEERAMVEARRPQQVAEQMWSAYFARYQQTYRRLVQQLIEVGDNETSFAYAERARAFEPLHLILARSEVPPLFRARIRSGESFQLSDVRDSLPDGTFLLQYAVLDDRTFVWIVWNRDYYRATLPVGNRNIERWTKSLQRFGRTGEFELFHAALAAPFEGLLREPLARIQKIHADQKSIPRVVIVPDRAMHGLPFSALRNGTRYVVQDFKVSVAASATLYAYSLAINAQRRSRAGGSILVVSDPTFDSTMEVANQLGTLEWARKETKEIAQLYDGKLHVESLQGPAATPAEFLRLARHSNIIHVAAHGIASSDTPSRSFLLFARSEHDSGAVDAERLLQSLQFTEAPLVVLAACSSVGGTPVGPEGLAPLVRPLLVAGAPAVIGTLWNVNDTAATAELLVHVHRYFRNGRDADDALRLAQLEMLGDPELGRNSAVAWAPFQAIGYASSPFSPENKERKWNSF